jgi:hypothetical protein
MYTPFFHFLVGSEPIWIFLCLVTLYRSGLAKRFPATRLYFLFQFVSALYLVFLLNVHHMVDVREVTIDYWYFYSYWLCYLFSGLLVVGMLREVFTSMMRQKPTVQRITNLVYRWAQYFAVVVAVALIASSLISTHKGYASQLLAASKAMMNAVTILELGLLAFIGLAYKSFEGRMTKVLMGLMLGLGIDASAQWIAISLQYLHHPPVWCVENYILQWIQDLILVSWIVLFQVCGHERLAEEEYSPMVSSDLLRWPAVASRFGQRPNLLARSTNNTSYFLEEASGNIPRNNLWQ